MCDPSAFPTFFTTLKRQIYYVGIDVAGKGMEEERFGRSPTISNPKLCHKPHGPFGVP